MLIFPPYKGFAESVWRDGELAQQQAYLCPAVALPTVNNLELHDITHSTMRVRWRAAIGATGYMILYAPLTEGESADEKEVRLERQPRNLHAQIRVPLAEWFNRFLFIYSSI